MVLDIWYQYGSAPNIAVMNPLQNVDLDETAEEPQPSAESLVDDDRTVQQLEVTAMLHRDEDRDGLTTRPMIIRTPPY